MKRPSKLTASSHDPHLQPLPRPRKPDEILDPIARPFMQPTPQQSILPIDLTHPLALRIPLAFVRPTDASPGERFRQLDRCQDVGEVQVREKIWSVSTNDPVDQAEEEDGDPDDSYEHQGESSRVPSERTRVGRSASPTPSASSPRRVPAVV